MSTASLDSNTRLRVISETTRAFLEATTDPQALLETIVERTALLIGDLCSIFLVSDDGTTLVPASLSGRDPAAVLVARNALTEPIVLANHPIMGGVVFTGISHLKPVVVSADLKPPRTTPNYYDFVQRVGVHSALIVALRIQGESIGTLALLRHGTDTSSYNDEDLAFAQILADHAALAISNSRLHAAERAARTDATRAGVALHETERSHQRFFELSPLAKFIYDSATERILAVNDAALRLYGYSREDFLAVQLADLREIEDPAVAAARRTAIGDADVVGTRRVRRKDGTTIDVEVWSNVAMFEGQTARLVAIIDVTERALLREAKASEARFRGLLEGAPDAIVITDQRGRIVLVNSQTETVFRYDRTELIGQPVEILIPQRHQDAHPSLRAKYFGAPKTRAMGAHLVLYGLRKDGTEFPVEISLSPLATQQGLQVMSTIRDVSERMQITVALAAANRELEAFSYSVAHDLRAPLRGMNGFAEILLETHKDKLDEEGLECVDIIQSNARKMSGLIDALLALARTSRSTFTPRLHDLSAMVRAASVQLAASHPERAVDVVIQDGVCAEVDVRLAAALLDNLLANAWKFTSKVPHPRVEFFAQYVNGVTSYCVRDNGAGFDMQYATSLFAPFQRLHSASEFPGTGVGLATAQRIVHRHGGRIWAESRVGKGAAFHFTLSHGTHSEETA